jgi:hypothetical protein
MSVFEWKRRMRMEICVRKKVVLGITTTGTTIAVVMETDARIVIPVIN